MKAWPALDVERLDDLLLAALDDFVPTAIEEHPPDGRIFFATDAHRDTARAALTGSGIAASPVDVPDDDWAVRSQQNLTPITVGRITVSPTSQPLAPRLRSRTNQASYGAAATSLQPLTIVIQPSMGFGTGHHATTRLCLAALQNTNVTGASVLDVGTGSGILAIAAARLGASHALGIDSDADAIQSAQENLALNPEAGDVEFVLAELATVCREEDGRRLFDVVLANLTGALLIRSASRLVHAVKSGGTLILSGILADEEETLRDAFAAHAGPNKVRPTYSVRPTWRRQEDEWVCLGYSVGTD